jgi:hypothetical protein
MDWTPLQRGLESWATRRERNKAFDYEKQRDDRLDKVQAERDRLQRLLIDQQVKNQSFEFDEKKKEAGARDALINFDPSQFSPPPLLPDEMGPPAPSADLSRPWHEQNPEIQRQVLASMVQKGVSAPAVAQYFNQMAQANSGRPIIPTAPAGMELSSFAEGGATFKRPETNGISIVDTPEGKLYFRGDQQLTPPKVADGQKELLGEELKHFGSLDRTKTDLDNIDSFLKQNVDKDFFQGPFAGQVRKLWNWLGLPDQDMALLNQQVAGATPTLARGVFGEVGVLTDADREEYKKQFPTITDKPELRAAKIEALKKKLDATKNTAIENFSAAGRDVEGFKAAPPAAAGPGAPAVLDPTTTPKFGSVQEFEASPAATGFVWDPTQGKYRPARKR